MEGEDAAKRRGRNAGPKAFFTIKQRIRLGDIDIYNKLAVNAILKTEIDRYLEMIKNLTHSTHTHNYIKVLV